MTDGREGRAGRLGAAQRHPSCAERWAGRDLGAISVRDLGTRREVGADLGARSELAKLAELTELTELEIAELA